MLRVTRRSVPWVTCEAVTGEGCTLCRGLLSHTPANGALIYPSQGGRYRAEGCMTLGSDSSVLNDPLVDPGRTPLYVGLPYALCPIEDDLIFSSRFVGELNNNLGV